jgi:PQQ-dependent dehydrogenase (s-GDH family)
MKTKLLLLLTFLLTINSFYSQNATTADTNNWNVTLVQLSQQLAYPFEITYGPDGWLWITERRNATGTNYGERVIRVNPDDGTKVEMIDLRSKVRYDGGQDGLLGMAIHPDLYNDIATTTNNYVFVAYTYDDAGSLKLRIARLVYDNNTKTLSPDTTLNNNGAIIEGLPASTDHQAGRLKIGPDLKLYYTIGDQGANQFNYKCNPNLAQVLPTSTNDYNHYAGKTLRLELDGAIPSDNPTLEGIQSHVYTYGHRNAQGLVFTSNGTLYNSEQMDKVDDELNIIVAGKNYGWPEIAGYYDDLGYFYTNYSISTDCGGSTAPLNVSEYESYPTGAPSNFEPPIGTIGSTSATEPTGSYLTWPTKAVSSLDIYEGTSVPGWGKSLFITSLKAATIYRAELTSDGYGIENDDKLPGEKPLAYEIFYTTNGSLNPSSNNDRFRDTAFDPNATGGFLMYAITDTNSQTNKGQIIKIEYTGPTASTKNEILNTFDLYPNPTNTGYLKLQLPNEITDYNITICNMLGQQIFNEDSTNNDNKTIDTSIFNKGIYFVTIASKHGKSTKKIVIQ